MYAIYVPENSPGKTIEGYIIEHIKKTNFEFDKNKKPNKFIMKDF